MFVIYGVVKQNIVVLPEDVELPEGTAVEVRIRQPRDSAPTASEYLFKQRLLASGLLTEIKLLELPFPERHTPIPVPGKPLSEIIAEERR